MKYLNDAGVKPDQVFVVTAESDYPHFATDKFAPNPEWSDIQSFFPTLRDYENSSGRYNYLFLKIDRSFRDRMDIHEYLGHGGMIDGAISDHSYDIIYNGQEFQNVPLRMVYTNISKGRGPNE